MEPDRTTVLAGLRVKVVRDAIREMARCAAIPFQGPLTCNAYRAVYTVRYTDAVYVLHAFQKKSKKGITTPKTEIDLIEKRLRDLIKDKEG